MQNTIPSSPISAIARRHDLDALRGFAMLLGIGLHASLAYAPIPWVIQDPQESGLFRFFFEMIHGFRMPLFFIVSGFFTAMLWRKRGLGALIKQRTSRIGLPLLISMITIVPATFIASLIGLYASANWGRQAVDPKASLVSAIRLGDVAEVKRHLIDGADPNQADSSFGATPLSWATMLGDSDSVQLLIDAGADVDRPNGDGATPLMSASFVGRPEISQLLLDNGANPTIKNNIGSTASDTLLADRATTEFIAGLLKLNLVWEDVQSGRERAGPILVKAEEEWATNALKANEIQDAAGIGTTITAEESSGPMARYRRWLHSDILEGLIYFPLFQHLWFLWFLCWFVCIFAIYAAISDILGWKGLPGWMIVSPLRSLWIIPLTFVPQWFMNVDFPTFGPGTSIGLLPQPHLLFYYAIFFAFGAFYFDCDDADGRLGRWWRTSLFLAIVVAYPLAIYYENSPWITATAQVAYTWAMSIGLMGMFRKFISTENAKVRYLSDSSYWLYLAHMPLIYIAQIGLLFVPLPAMAKFVVVCVSVTGILLISYQYGVRYTLIGRMLNGHRIRPIVAVQNTTPAPMPS